MQERPQPYWRWVEGRTLASFVERVLLAYVAVMKKRGRR
jgi:hypothetical protein